MIWDKWFKHYNNAHQGQTIATLWAENDTECIGVLLDTFRDRFAVGRATKEEEKLS